MFEPKTPNYADRVRDSSALQGAMATLAARLERIEAGAVDIALDWAPSLTQQHGFLHAGMVATALDSACGYAAFTLMAEDAAVLTIEFKINLLAPPAASRFACRGASSNPGARSPLPRAKLLRSTTGGRRWWPRWDAR